VTVDEYNRYMVSVWNVLYCCIAVIRSMCVYIFVGFLKDDVDNMVRVGFDAYRFSISWSRIFPNMSSHKSTP
jgi:hypothetical protein